MWFSNHMVFNRATSRCQAGSAGSQWECRTIEGVAEPTCSRTIGKLWNVSFCAERHAKSGEQPGEIHRGPLTDAGKIVLQPQIGLRAAQVAKHRDERQMGV